MANKDINKIGKDFDKVVADMKKLAGDYAKATGDKKQELLKKLKDLTAKKKDLKSQLERAVTDADKSVELQIDERYMKIAVTSMINQLVEQEVKSIIPNRASRRYVQRILEKKSNERFLDEQSNRYVKNLKTSLTEKEWDNLRNFVLPITGVTEAGEMTDSDVAKAIAQIAKEVTNGQLEIDPKDINVGALEDPKSEPDDIVKETRKPLNEGDPVTTAILTAPSVLKVVANVGDYIGSFFVKGGYKGSDKAKEGRAITSILNKIYKITKKNKNADGSAYIMPSRRTLAQQLKLEPDQKELLDKAMDRIEKFIRVDNKKERKKKYAWILAQPEYKDASISKKKEIIQLIKDNPDIYADKEGMRKFKKFTGIDIFNTSGKKFHAAKAKTSSETEPVEIDDHVLHIMQSATYDTKFGKAIGGFAHKLHELFLVPFRHVVAAVIWIASKGKSAIKKGWNWLKKKFGYEAEESDWGLSYEEAYDKSKKMANILYSIGMLVYAVYAIAQHGFNFTEAWEKIKEIISGVKDSSMVFKTVNAIKSSVESLYTTVLDGLKAGDLTAEIGAIFTDFWESANDVIV